MLSFCDDYDHISTQKFQHHKAVLTNRKKGIDIRLTMWYIMKAVARRQPTQNDKIKKKFFKKLLKKYLTNAWKCGKIIEHSSRGHGFTEWNLNKNGSLKIEQWETRRPLKITLTVIQFKSSTRLKKYKPV